MEKNLKRGFIEFGLITISTFLVAFGTYVFKFPNNFSFGGVTGLAIILAKVIPFSASTITFVINMALLSVGFVFLGKSFGIKTVYASILLSILLSVMEKVYPLTAPLTNDALLELMYAVFVPAFGMAVLFNIGASSGGTDIIAMIMKKYTSFNTGSALFITDLIIVILSFIMFDIKTGLFSFLGLMLKSLVVDEVIESINRCKYFNVVCDTPEPICDFIVKKLNRSATICRAEGAYAHKQRVIIFTALKPSQAVQLRNYIRKVEPTAFILISNTSEIIGKGFQQ